MNLVRKNRWFAMAAGLTLVFAGVSLVSPPGVALASASDLGYFVLTLAVGGIMWSNAWSSHGPARRFWLLMGAGYLTWSVNTFGWLYFEAIRHWPVPDPWPLDSFLFLHLIPMLAAVGLRPHRAEGEERYRLGTLDFMLLLVWWFFLYQFVIFPSQYITVDVATYDTNFALLYFIQSGMLVVSLLIAAWGNTGGWRKVYLHLMAANALYCIASQAVNYAMAVGKYHTGSFYDVALMGAVSWMAATALSARDWKLEAVTHPGADRWAAISIRLSMLAILSLPVLGLWTYLWDHSPGPNRAFRLFTVLGAMLVLGVFVFLRQHRQDRTLIGLLEESRHSYVSQQRLQSHLVQKEKLASLGQLLAGAAREIDLPLAAILASSDQLNVGRRLNPEQDTLLRKLVHHAQRTRELIAHLLSFAQQTSGEKATVDLRRVLERCLQTNAPKIDGQVQIKSAMPADLPKVWGDAEQLLQALEQIMENGVEALQESGGGLLRVSAQADGDEVVVQFSDNGPGIKEPHRVFDPFYTTKPVGKGTGLGLSAVYGVVQDHGGQITCQNGAEGGAIFTLRLPILREVAPPQVMAVGKA